MLWGVTWERRLAPASTSIITVARYTNDNMHNRRGNVVRDMVGLLLVVVLVTSLTIIITTLG